MISNFTTTSHLTTDYRVGRFDDIRELLPDVDHPTPLVRLNRVASGATVYLKLEWLNPFGSIKDRAALSMIELTTRSDAVDLPPIAEDQADPSRPVTLLDTEAEDQTILDRVNAAAYAALADWDGPVNVIFGDSDDVFTAEWGRQFADHLGATFDLNGDGVVDREDVQLILAARNTPADGPDDPRDMNGDGVIDVVDARLATLACDLPSCASPPP